MLYILYGDDDFSLSEALAEIKAGLGDESSVATNTTVLQGSSVTPEEIAATCDTIPFLAPHRLIIVEGLLARFEQQQGKARRPRKAVGDSWSSFGEYVQRMPNSSVLALIDRSLRKNNRLLKQLAPLADVTEFKPLVGAELVNWIQHRASLRGSNLAPGDAKSLADLVGGNLWLMSNEIDKLCTYALGRPIEGEDIELLVPNAREPNVFAMIDAILDRRATQAARLLHRLENDGAAPPYLLFMITRQFRLVLQTKDLLQRKRKPAEIGSAIGISNEYALRKTLEQARQHSLSRLGAIYRRLLDTDVAIKTSRFRGDKGELALDLLICDLCAEAT